MTVVGKSGGEKLQSPIIDSPPKKGEIATCSQFKQTGEPSMDCSRESTNGALGKTQQARVKQGLQDLNTGINNAREVERGFPIPIDFSFQV